MNIVVMGGSFNPPTIAHWKILQTALNAVQADMGFLVPVSFPYLKRKMIKAGESHLSLPDEVRIQMLETMARRDSRIQIFTDVMGEPFSDDVGFLKRIQGQYPEATVYYIAGADKLVLLDHFARKKKEFFQHFRCLLYARDSTQLLADIAANPNLAEHQDAFVLVQPPEGIEGVSSTKIREHLFDVDAVADMLLPEVAEMVRGLKPEDYPEEILHFRGQYAFLSNDFPAEVAYQGVTYPSAAVAFLASKVEDPEERAAMARMKPEKAKNRYSSRPGGPAWEAQKTDIMQEILRLKFAQHPDLLEQLEATGSRLLIYGGKDSFWGMNLTMWEGRNELGRLLMKLRTEQKRNGGTES